MVLAPITSTSLEVAVGSGSTRFGAAMLARSFYLFVSNVACWISQGATPTATAGAGSMYVPAGVAITLSGESGADLAVIEDSTGGKASLTRLFNY